MNTAIIAINPGTVTSHENYRQKYDLPFPLLSDPDRAVSHAYQALKPNGKSIQRTVLILDQNGVVRYVKQGMPKDSELLQVLERLGS